MTLIEQITQHLLLWLTIMSPNPVPVEVWSQPQNLPSVYIIPQRRLANAVCGCECSLLGMYLGGPDRIILLGGDDSGNLPNDFFISSIHLHELEHYFQDLQHTILKGPVMSRKEREHDAYVAQNRYLVMNGFFPTDINNSVNASTNIAYGKVECSNGTVGIPPDPSKVYDILYKEVFKYESNHVLYDIYQFRLSDISL